jgi:AcrR family transcriptional regulator
MTVVNPRRPLNRQRVLRAAADLADAEGIDALTMRRLGQKLGVEAMSLYNHVANKDDLLDGLVDLIAAEVSPAPEGEIWKAKLRHLAVSIHATLLRHQWAGVLWVSRHELMPARMSVMEEVLATLRHAEFPPELLDLAFHTVQNHVLGHALQAVTFGIEADEVVAGGRLFLAQLDIDAYPEIAAHVRWHIEGPSDGDDAFTFGLDLILDGLERARDAMART